MEYSATAGIILSRFNSSRLPGKALEEIGGVSILERVIRRMKQTRFLDSIVLATTTSEDDDQLIAIANRMEIHSARGSEDDVLGRCVQAIQKTDCDTVVVAYGDNPLLDPHVVELLVSFRQREGLDYAFMPGLPIGADVSVFSRSALERAAEEATAPEEREHLNAYITAHPELFRFGRVSPPSHLNRTDLRLTVDTDVDLQLMRDLEDELCKRNAPLSLNEVVALANEMPEMFVVNADVQQNYANDAWKKLRSGGVN